MRLISTMICVASLLLGCSGSGSDGYDSTVYVYDDWLYHHDEWYDDEFWIWVDDHPDCCEDADDIRQALQEWYDDLDEAQQEAVRDRVERWMEERGVEPGAGQSARDLVLDTAAERWTALTPAERQEWLAVRQARIERRRVTGGAAGLSSEQQTALRERAAGLSPEQIAALRESAQGVSLDPDPRLSGRDLQGYSGGFQRSISFHPTPGRAGLSGGTGFRAAGGGRGGRR